MMLRALNPRCSLAAAIGWLVFALSLSLALVADLWLDEIVRNNLLDQRNRQLERTADRVAARVDLNLKVRVQKIRVLAATMRGDFPVASPSNIRATLEGVQRASPDFAWISVATPNGYGLAGTHGASEGALVSGQAWFARSWHDLSPDEVGLGPSGSDGPKIPAKGPGVAFTTRVLDQHQKVLAVIGAGLGEPWADDLARGMRQELGDPAGSDVLLLDRTGTVLVGPRQFEGHLLEHFDADNEGPTAPPSVMSAGAEWSQNVFRLADGVSYLVAHPRGRASDSLRQLGWRVTALQSLDNALQPVHVLQREILLVLVGLGLLAATAGTLLARHATRDIEAIARSADAVRSGTLARVVVPGGQSEAARLGQALDELVSSLQDERAALQAMNADLDRRVAARTREVERLWEQARYDALVRERLKIARDLHDTLAHSMMAMLTEIRLLRRLWASHDVTLGEELVRAEETAHQGLLEARAAIGQMRFNPVRDSSLAAALQDHVRLFGERTGITSEFDSDVHAGALSDARAETLFRIAEEALRNVERHSGATRVKVTLSDLVGKAGVTLSISDDGIGFDAAADYPGHYGLAGLREQAQLIQAQFEILSTRENGTVVRVDLPE